MNSVTKSQLPESMGVRSFPARGYRRMPPEYHKYAPCFTSVWVCICSTTDTELTDSDTQKQTRFCKCAPSASSTPIKTTHLHQPRKAPGEFSSKYAPPAPPEAATGLLSLTPD